ncbi:MAG: FAD-binding oxidoreductase [Pseudomonadota bacterium]
MAETADVLIVGGGLHGLSAALHLARAGARVTLCERDRTGAHASGVNAGGVRRLGRALPEIPLAVLAAERWRRLPEIVGEDGGYRESRYLKVAFTEEALEDARRRVARLAREGHEHEEVIGRDRLRSLMPAASPDCLGALHVEGDGSAIPYRVTRAFHARAAALGARIEEARPVTAIARRGPDWRAETPAGPVTAPVVVNAAGAWGGRVAGWLGDALPLEAHAPMLAVTTALPPLTDAVVGILGEALSLKQFPNGTVLIGGGMRGTAHPETGRTTLDIAGVARFLQAARRVFPQIAGARLNRLWAGIEGYTPDGLPVIGHGSAPGVVHAFGFSAHGFQLAPAAGEQVAALALGRAPAVDLAAFDPRRFASSRIAPAKPPTARPAGVPA